MLKIDIEDLIFEVKDELSCYEEIGENGANQWEVEFRKWLSSDVRKNNVSKSGNSLAYAISDESEVFDIADEYLNALETNSVDEYWKKFQ